MRKSLEVGTVRSALANPATLAAPEAAAAAQALAAAEQARREAAFKRRREIRVIVLTGSDSVEGRRRAERAGVDAFVEKRHAVRQLAALIASL